MAQHLRTKPQLSLDFDSRYELAWLVFAILEARA